MSWGVCWALGRGSFGGSWLAGIGLDHFVAAATGSMAGCFVLGLEVDSIGCLALDWRHFAVGHF